MCFFFIFQRLFVSECLSLLSRLLIPIRSFFFRAFHLNSHSLHLSPSICLFSLNVIFLQKLYFSLPLPLKHTPLSVSLSYSISAFFCCTSTWLFISPLFPLLFFSRSLWRRRLIMWGWAVLALTLSVAKVNYGLPLSARGAADVERAAGWGRWSGRKIKRPSPQKWFDLLLVWKCSLCPSLSHLLFLQCHPHFPKDDVGLKQNETSEGKETNFSSSSLSVVGSEISSLYTQVQKTLISTSYQFVFSSCNNPLISLVSRDSNSDSDCRFWDEWCHISLSH